MNQRDQNTIKIGGLGLGGVGVFICLLIYPFNISFQFPP